MNPALLAYQVTISQAVKCKTVASYRTDSASRYVYILPADPFLVLQGSSGLFSSGRMRSFERYSQSIPHGLHTYAEGERYNTNWQPFRAIIWPWYRCSVSRQLYGTTAPSIPDRCVLTRFCVLPTDNMADVQRWNPRPHELNVVLEAIHGTSQEVSSVFL